MKFNEKDLDKVLSNELINETLIPKFLKFYDDNGFTDKRRFVSYIFSLKNLENWDKNYFQFEKYSKSLKSVITAGLYDPEYIRLKCNISYEEAIKIIEDRKTRKATNLKGFIARHGETKGKELYEKFQKTSISASKEHVNEYERKRRSVWCKEFYEHKGFSEEESIKLAKEFNKQNSGANKYYWIGKGYNAQQIDQIMSKINLKKSFGIKDYKEKYGDHWKEKWDERIEKLRRTINAIPNDDEWKNYHNECWKWTNISLKLYGDTLENIHFRGREHNYQLDHIFSIKQGYLNMVDPEIIGNITNLRVITTFENCSKQDNCDKTLTELYQEYEEHESKINSSN